MSNQTEVHGDKYDSNGGGQTVVKDHGTMINIYTDGKQPVLFPSPSLLPSPPNLFIGRDNDMAALRQRLFGEPSTTLITSVRGWPGIGKTTLAAAMAHDAEVKKAFPDGVLWTALGMSPNPLAGLGQWLPCLR